MSRGISFGEILRDARIRRGMDLSTIARKLRIREDILAAIESGDFARMPARGHAKSMIAAYARLVGTSPTDMVRMYSDELYAFEVGRVRSRTSASAREASRGAARAADERRRDSAGAYRDGQGRSGRSAGMRGARPDDAPYYDGGGRRASYSDRTARPAAQGRVYEQSRVHASRGGNLPTASTHYTNLVAAPKNIGATSSKKPFVLVAAVGLVLLLVICGFMFGGKNDKAAEELPSVPVSGLTDTSTPTDQAPASAAPVAPTSAEFSYKVSGGSSAYIEVYVDGSDRPSEAGDVSGGTSQRYEVAGTLKFVTTNPENVSLTVDGASVEPTDDDGNGVYTYTVDFATILANWQAENASALEAANAASASGVAAGAAGSAGSANATTSGASASAANS